MEITRQQGFLVLLHDKEGRVAKLVLRTEALDLAVEAAKNTHRKEGYYAAVYAEIGVCK